MKKLLHPHSPFRIFFFSSLMSAGVLVLIAYYLGTQAVLTALVLIVIELTFSFDNAIVNARVLEKMNKFWQQMFMTVGILIAIFGMRIVFPVLIVMLTAGLDWGSVVSLALSQPEQYAHELERAEPSIAAFGGMFLLMLCLHFFFDAAKEVHWLERFELWLQKVGQWWMHAAVSGIALAIIILLPFNHHPMATLVAGTAGILTYLAIHGLSTLMTRKHSSADPSVKAAGLAGLVSFLYLEVLDASFSLDGVIGAFAISNDIVIIAAGLGVGALWVRSLTLFMVRRGTLDSYRYMEHGAHYTIGILALILLVGLFVHIPEAVGGALGVGIIGLAIAGSIRAKELDEESAQ